MPVAEAAVIDPEALDDLVRALVSGGFASSARSCATVRSSTTTSSPPAELPIGWTDDQSPGRYRLERRDDEARFGYAVGPHSWKQFLLPARIRLWRARRDDGFCRRARADGRHAARPRRRARLRAPRDRDPGQRAPRGPYADGDYAARRKDAFIVAVNCFEPGGTCFCVSMGSGPKAEAGYDLALTEILDGAPLPRRGRDDARRRRPGRPPARGRPSTATGGRLPSRRGSGAEDGPAARHDRSARHARAQPRARSLGRGRVALPHLRQLHAGLPDVLLHERRGHTDLAGDEAERVRAWDSCYSRRLLVHPRRQHPALGALALPPVADAQVRHVARPVRHARAASAAAAASPGARSGST